MPNRRSLPAIVLAASLAACSGTQTAGPAPNTATARFDDHQNVLQIETSDVQPPTSVELIAGDGRHIPAPMVTVVSAPRADDDSGSGFGFGIGPIAFSAPFGGSASRYAMSQFHTVSTIPAPRDYGRHWQTFSIRVQYGARAVILPAPNPQPS